VGFFALNFYSPQSSKTSFKPSHTSLPEKSAPSKFECPFLVLCRPGIFLAIQFEWTLWLWWTERSAIRRRGIEWSNSLDTTSKSSEIRNDRGCWSVWGDTLYAI